MLESHYYKPNFHFNLHRINLNHPMMLNFVEFPAYPVQVTNLSNTRMSTFGALQILTIFQVNLVYMPFSSIAIISKSSSARSSLHSIYFLTQRHSTTQYTCIT